MESAAHKRIAGPLLAAQEIGRQTQQGVWLLKGINLEICAGDQLSLIGKAGSGKSLLLRALALLDSCNEGMLRWEDAPILPREIPQFRSRVAYLPQKPAIWGHSVEDSLRSPFELKVHQAKNFDRPALVQRLALVGRDETFLEKQVSNMSGGEAQITALLRTLQLDPSVLLLDEPTASLDPQTTAQVEHLISAWCEEDTRRAFLWVSHDLELAQRLGRRQLKMEAGRLQELVV